MRRPARVPPRGRRLLWTSFPSVGTPLLRPSLLSFSLLLVRTWHPSSIALPARCLVPKYYNTRSFYGYPLLLLLAPSLLLVGLLTTS